MTTATPVATGKTEDDFPAACYGPDGTLWVAYVAYHVRDEDRRIEQKPLKGQPKDFKALDTPEFGDQVMVKSNRDGKWGEPIADHRRQAGHRARAPSRRKEGTACGGL